MKRDVRIGGKNHRVEAERRDDRWEFRIDGKSVDADVAEIAPGVYSILLAGKSLVARIEPRNGRTLITVRAQEILTEVSDPRRLRRGRGLMDKEGHQQVLAPMPGKAVRVLVRAGQEVAAGQAILVLEAMKMQNEVRSPKKGRIEGLLVKEGQAVNAGDLLAIVG
jgi:biotin carboxyl carrier protein